MTQPAWQNFMVLYTFALKIWCYELVVNKSDSGETEVSVFVCVCVHVCERVILRDSEKVFTCKKTSNNQQLLAESRYHRKK